MIPDLFTSRLLLRAISLDDAQNMFNMNADPAVVRYTGNKGYKNIEEVVEFISTYDQYENTNREE